MYTQTVRIYLYIHRNSILHCNGGFLCTNLSLPQITWVFFPNIDRRRQTTQKADHQPINHQPSPCESSGGLGMTNPTAPRNNVLLSGRNKWPRRPKVMAAMTSTSGGQPFFFFGGVQPAVFIKVLNALIGLVAFNARNNIN